MKALAIRQPYASLIARGVKTIETRSWSTKYRGPLAIHAGATIPGLARGDRLTVGDAEVERDNPRRSPPAYLLRSQRLAWPYRLPLGAVVATCTLVDVVPIVGEWHGRPLAPLVVSTPGRLRIVGDERRDIESERPYGYFVPGWYAWLLEDIAPVREPVPAKGRQGLWEWAP